MTLKIPRRTYADLYGPTKGDRIRLADTDLIIEIEKDFTHYGDEITFGGGKGNSRRHGPKQHRHPRNKTRRARSRHHQRRDSRSLGNRQGRHRRQRRPHRWNRQSRKS